jgi:3-oxoacyl-(acyl-carrier-protein) synthase
MPLDLDIRIAESAYLSCAADGVPAFWSGLLAGSLRPQFPEFELHMPASSYLFGAADRLASHDRCDALVVATTKGNGDMWWRRLDTNTQRAADAQLFEATSLPGASSKRRLAVSNACVSGAQAVIEGVEVLLDDEATRVLVIAGDKITDFVTAGFQSLNAVGSHETARPFDNSRDGLSLGEAGCAVVLRRGPAHERHPRIISYGCSNDANHISGPSRDGSGLALAIERALVGIDRREIRAICAHGTATQYNDAMEARAFHTVFGGEPPPVFGIKGAIGHTLGAAGLIEVIISAMVATEGVIPPTVGFEEGETDFPLDVVHGKPRKIKPGFVLTTNSGFGGMNTAIVVGPGR